MAVTFDRVAKVLNRRIIFFIFRMWNLLFVRHSRTPTVNFICTECTNTERFFVAIVKFSSVIHQIVKFQLKIVASQLHVRRDACQFFLLDRNSCLLEAQAKKGTTRLFAGAPYRRWDTQVTSFFSADDAWPRCNVEDAAKALLSKATG